VVVLDLRELDEQFPPVRVSLDLAKTPVQPRGVALVGVVIVP
jgi:hypothetical protein